MSKLFLSIYDFFLPRRKLLLILVIIITIVAAYFASRIGFEEDIVKFIPKDAKIDRINYVMQNLNYKDKLFISISFQDTSNVNEQELLTLYSDSLFQLVVEGYSSYIHDITNKIPEDRILSVFSIFQKHLPIFIDDKDYKRFDSLLQPEYVDNVIRNNYKTLVSPSGFVMKKFVAADPLGITFNTLKKLQTLQLDENYDTYNGYIVTKDSKNALLFLTSKHPSSETSLNGELLEGLDKIIYRLEQNSGQKIKIHYYGAIAVAISNASRLKIDTNITLTIAFLIIIILLSIFFRKKTVSLIIMLPVVFGIIISLAAMYLIKSSISAIAIGAGAIVVGIAINYSIHIFTHYRQTHSIRNVVKELSSPLTIGGFTTVGAFFCLVFLKSEALRDFGLFSGITLIGAALFSLIVMPHMLGRKSTYHEEKILQYHWLDKITNYRPDKNKWIIIGIFIFTIFFFFMSRRVGFEGDLTNINYVNPKLAQSESYFENIGGLSKKSIFIVSTGKNIDEAIIENENLTGKIKTIMSSSNLVKLSSPEMFLISENKQNERIKRWENYWTFDKIQRLKTLVNTSASKYGFNLNAFDDFYSVLEKKHNAVKLYDDTTIYNLFLSNYISKTSKMTMISAIVKAPSQESEAIYKTIENDEKIVVFDRKMFSSKFIDVISSDFNLILVLSSLLVFITLFLTYGRIELALVTFIPMLLSWIWIIGIMGLFGLEFNIINIIISAFIFGLGDDFSIFIMDGMLQEYEKGTKVLASHKVSIFLSTLTVIIGFGSLMFAKHPALKSIAIITVIGMFCVLFISITVEPFLFRLLIGNRMEKKRPPMTWYHLFVSCFSYGVFITGSFLATIVGFITIKIIPIKESQKRIVFHSIIRYFSKALIYVMVNVKKRIINPRKENFIKPAVIIANHQSHIDLPFMFMLKTKLVVLTNDWVQNNVFYGKAVQLADFHPVSAGLDKAMDFLENRVKQGYSILVYPEGTRSANGDIKRFHKGAFYIAEKLKIDIIPLVIHGTGHAMTKGDDFMLKNGIITMNVLDRIGPNDNKYGNDYSEKTKAIEKLFKEEYLIIKNQTETPRFFANKLIKNYIYKGPILEWYTRIKIRLDNYFEDFHRLLPLNGHIVDIGCGYGYLTYMLSYLSKNRTFTSIDYDEDKIEIANNCYSKNKNIKFINADITTFELPNAEAFVISDVLHYLPEVEQKKLLIHCCDLLSQDGVIVVRDADSEMKSRHLGTRYTEFFSTRFGFNKTRNGKLFFTSRKLIEQVAEEMEFALKINDNTRFTSNVIYVLTKKKNLE